MGFQSLEICEYQDAILRFFYTILCKSCGWFAEKIGNRHVHVMTVHDELNANVRRWDNIEVNVCSMQVLVNEEIMFSLELNHHKEWRVVGIRSILDPKNIFFHANPGIVAANSLYECVADLAMSGYTLDEVILEVIQYDHFFDEYAPKWRELIWEMMRWARGHTAVGG